MLSNIIPNVNNMIVNNMIRTMIGIILRRS